MAKFAKGEGGNPGGLPKAQGAVAVLDQDAMLDQIANGAFLRDLSEQTGIDKRRLSEQLRKHPDYALAKQCSIECQLDDTQTGISDAKDVTDIARAREAFRAASWRAEREASHIWGSKQQVTVLQGPTLDSALDSLAAALLDKMRVVATQEQEQLGVDLAEGDHA